MNQSKHREPGNATGSSAFSRFPRRRVGVLAAAAICCAALAGAAAVATGRLNPEFAGSANVAGQVRIGTYDSRALAVAYVRSEFLAKKLQELRRQQQEAEKSGDKKALEAINARGESMQVRMHLQGFSNAPVDDVLDSVRDKLAGVAQQANVVAIASHADYHDQAVEVVDITDELAQLFNPSKETLNVIKDLRKKPALPIEEVARMPAKK